jgi:predicted nucleic acid-binding protein
MSGERYLLDTNAVVALLRGDEGLHERLADAEWVGISILSYIEFLAFSNLSAEDRQVFLEFSSRVNVIGLGNSDLALIDLIVALRRQYRLRLPDAIIAATAQQARAILITEDVQLRKLATLNCIGIH